MLQICYTEVDIQGGSGKSTILVTFADDTYLERKVEFGMVINERRAPCPKPSLGSPASTRWPGGVAYVATWDRRLSLSASQPVARAARLAGIWLFPDHGSPHRRPASMTTPATA